MENRFWIKEDDQPWNEVDAQTYLRYAAQAGFEPNNDHGAINTIAFLMIGGFIAGTIAGKVTDGSHP